VGPVVAAWRTRHPQGLLTIQSAIPHAVLCTRISGAFDWHQAEADFGMVMADAVTVRLDESLARYRAFHAGWQEHLAWQTGLLVNAAPSVVLADVPYLTLTAAADVGVPAVAMCSLNWADVLAAYVPLEAADDVLAQMRLSYNQAAVFLCPAPSMPMPGLANTLSIGPIAMQGRHVRPELNLLLALSGHETLVLVTWGGLDIDLDALPWPSLPNVVWLMPPGWRVVRPDMRCRASLGAMALIDVLCSCDLVLTKPGYGTFTEAACNGVPVLYVERDDWPEEPFLSDWLHAHARAVRLSKAQFAAGALADALAKLLAMPAVAPVAPTGAKEAADWLDRVSGVANMEELI
jgi:hypothetical protein